MCSEEEEEGNYAWTERGERDRRRRDSLTNWSGETRGDERTDSSFPKKSLGMKSTCNLFFLFFLENAKKYLQFFLKK